MKKFLILLLALLIMLCGCKGVENIDIPEKMTAPTEPSPTPVATPEATTEEPQPSPPAPEEVPATLADLSAKIGMRVFTPEADPDGYTLTHIGYDGESTAALKYTAGEATLLYTFYPGTLDAPENATATSAYGLKTYFSSNGISSMLQWVRGGNTYQIIAEPARTESELSRYMKIMLSGPILDADEITVECSDITELSQKVGFTVWEPAYLPDNASRSEIHCYKLYTAVQKYLLESDMLTFRCCEGDISPSFDAAVYKDPVSAEVGNTAVTYYLNGNGKVILAEWLSGGYTHQIFSENGVSTATMEMMIVGFSK